MLLWIQYFLYWLCLHFSHCLQVERYSLSKKKINKLIKIKNETTLFISIQIIVQT